MQTLVKKKIKQQSNRLFFCRSSLKRWAFTTRILQNNLTWQPHALNRKHTTTTGETFIPRNIKILTMQTIWRTIFHYRFPKKQNYRQKQNNLSKFIAINIPPKSS